MVLRARHFLAAASAALVVRILVACSTSSAPAPAAPYDATPGETFTACQIQGYVSESEGGLCPEGTCPVQAFDTNGARVPCCTSIVSGPGMCVGDGGTSLADGSEAAADATDATDAADAAEAAESSQDATIEGGTDGASEADADGGASEGAPPPDAADGE